LSVVGRALYYAIANHDTGLAIYRAGLGAEAAPRPSSPKLVFADRKEKNFRGALVVGDQVVYSTTDGLFKVDKRGKRETLAEGWCNNKGVVGNTIYFHTDPLYARHDQLRKVDLDGSNLQTLLPVGAPPKRLNLDDHSYGFLNVFGDWLYYVSYDAALGSRVIHRVRPDGSEEERLNDKEATMINVVGDQIFFANNSDARRLYRINVDGSHETCLDAQPNITSIHVFDDLVFCPFSLDEKFIPAKMFTVQTDGSGHRELF
jgi:hypothetical protein